MSDTLPAIAYETCTTTPSAPTVTAAPPPAISASLMSAISAPLVPIVGTTIAPRLTLPSHALPPSPAATRDDRKVDAAFADGYGDGDGDVTNVTAQLLRVPRAAPI